MKPEARPGTVIVSADGDGLVSHAGTVLLAEVADRTGLTDGLSAALSATRERRSAHAPGRVLRDVAVMLADGGDCVTDLEGLRGQERLFGSVASETTTHRTLKAIDGTLLTPDIKTSRHPGIHSTHWVLTWRRPKPSFRSNRPF